MLLFAWNVTQGSWNQSVVIHHDRATCPLLIINWGAHFDNRTFRILHNGWIDCRDTFMLFSVYSAV